MSNVFGSLEFHTFQSLTFTKQKQLKTVSLKKNRNTSVPLSLCSLCVSFFPSELHSCYIPCFKNTDDNNNRVENIQNSFKAK